MPQAVRPATSTHSPLAVAAAIGLSDRAAVDRVCQLLGLPTGRLPIATGSAAAVDPLAVTRAGAELLLTWILSVYPVCPDCSGGARELECAGEIGVLIERLASLAFRARLAIAWRLASTKA